MPFSLLLMKKAGVVFLELCKSFWCLKRLSILLRKKVPISGLCLEGLYSSHHTENPKNKTKGGDVNMEELVGNTDGFADSGYVAFIGINSPH